MMQVPFQSHAVPPTAVQASANMFLQVPPHQFYPQMNSQPLIPAGNWYPPHQIFPRPLLGPPQMNGFAPLSFGPPGSRMGPPGSYRPDNRRSGYGTGMRHNGRGRGWGNRGGRGKGQHNTGSSSKGPAEYVCKTCNKEYKMEENYQIHMQTHQKCTSCDFEAHPKVLKEHELVHILPDELKFTSPEEIEKWRQQRRKNYPTAANIALKKQLLADREVRGEVAQTQLHRYIKHLVGDNDQKRYPGSGRGWRGRRGRGRGRGRGGRSSSFGKQWNRNYDKSMDTTEKHDVHEDIASTSSETFNSSPPAEKDDIINETANIIDKNESKLDLNSVEKDSNDGDTDASIVSAILADVTASSLLDVGDKECMLREYVVKEDYSSPAASKAAPSVKTSVGDHVTSASDHVTSVDDHVTSDSDHVTSTSDHVTIASDHVTSDNVNSRKRGREWVSRRQVKRRKAKSVLSVTPTRKPTLLEKLLAPEIRREENAILQCIRHVVKNDFFGLGN